MIQDTRAAVWKTYACWATGVGVVFFAVYPACNWVTAQRSPDALHVLYSAEELKTPLIPQFIWAYLSMYVLFALPPFFLDVPALRRLGKRLIVGTLIAGAVFLLFPSRLGFTRIVPGNPLYAAIFSRMFAVDLPFNNMPSLHVVFSALITGALARSRHWLRWPAGVWLALICASTLLVHQHHVADIAAGLLLAWALQKVRFGRFTKEKTAC